MTLKHVGGVCARLRPVRGPEPKFVLQPAVDLDVLDEGGERIMPGSTATANSYNGDVSNPAFIELNLQEVNITLFPRSCTLPGGVGKISPCTPSFILRCHLNYFHDAFEHWISEIRDQGCRHRSYI